MSTTFNIKRGDLLPKLRATLRNADKSLMNLTGATVNFRMKPPGGAIKVEAPATVVDPVNGVVEYTWAGTDTDTEDLYDAEFPVNRAGALETVPADGFIKVRVGPRL